MTTSLPTSPADLPASASVPALQVQFALHRVIEHIVMRDDAHTSLAALPPLQSKCLQIVAAQEDQRLVDVAARMQTSLPVASRVVDRLVRQGFLDRLADSTDRRAMRLRLTTQARTLIEQIEAQRLARIASCLSKLDQTEIESLVTGLSAMADAAPDPPGRLLHHGGGT